MTETVSDGAGADPSLLNTVAQQDGDGFLITGKKYMITGVPDAAINIVMARTLDPYGKDLGATMFFVDLDAPGFRLDRMLETIDSNSPGGHAEVSFDRVRVTPDRVLGEVGQGFRNAQVRLGPARLTHCMRWLGSVRRGAARRSRRNMPGAGIRSAAPSASIRAWASCSPTMKSTCICHDWRSGIPRGCWTSTTRRATRPA
jgi:alkylation response protein AidB-like acyl-CoA dehydrogenase